MGSCAACAAQVGLSRNVLGMAPSGSSAKDDHQSLGLVINVPAWTEQQIHFVADLILISRPRMIVKICCLGRHPIWVLCFCLPLPAEARATERTAGLGSMG